MTEDPVIVRPMIFGFAEGGAIRSRIARRSSRWRGFQSLLLVALLVVAQPAAADEATCGSLRYRHGPYDYRTSAWARNWAEKYHFTPEVEQLKKGASTSYIGQDLDFVLLAIPNHSRALAVELSSDLSRRLPVEAACPVAHSAHRRRLAVVGLQRCHCRPRRGRVAWRTVGPSGHTRRNDLAVRSPAARHSGAQ